MLDLSLTPEQQAIVEEDGEQFVIACPGAGKTRVVAERFVRMAAALPRARGLAVLSFTRAAADEISARCHRAMQRPAGFPHFIGTVDAFLNRYLVLPFEIPVVGRKPDVLDSYARLHIAARPYIKGTRLAAGLTLDELIPGVNGSLTIDSRRADARIRKIIDKDQVPWVKEGLRRLKNVWKAGYINAEAARAIALSRMRDPAFTEAMAPVLAARFAHVTIDEAQDSCADEIELFEWLRRAGIAMSFVGDPDQSIFEFRDARPDVLAERLSALPQRALTTNFRSTDNVCRAAATLTPTRPVAVAAGTFASENHPLLLIRGGDAQAQVSRFVQEVDGLDIPSTERVVLAHRRRDVESYVSSSVRPNVVDRGRVECLVHAARCFRSTKDTRDRQLSLDVVERFLLQLQTGADTGEAIPSRRCEEAGLDAKQLRRDAYAVLLGLPLPQPGDTPQSWQAIALAHLRGVAGAAISAKDFRILSPEAWNRVSSPVSAPPAISAITIHQAKGREFDAVLLALPFHKVHSPPLVEAWRTGTASEALRVLYVALTRARRLLGVAVDDRLAADVAQLLRTRGAAVTILSAN